MTIANITINGHTYTDAMWRADWEGTISAIANDIASVQIGIAAAGTLTKSISGAVTLSGAEGQNQTFVFTGSLSGDAAITFPAGFKGLACVVNETSGNHQLVIGLAAGAAVTIPALGGALLYCDGTDFGVTNGWVRTSAGAKLTGTASVTGAMTIAGAATLSSTLAVAGNATLGGTASVTGAATVGGAMTVTGAATLSSTLAVTGNATLGGTASITGAATVGGAASVAGSMTIGGGTQKVNSASGDARSILSATAGNSCWIELDLAGVQRWLAGKNNTTETGSDAGSDFSIVRFNDAGSQTGVPVIIRRSDGVIMLGELPSSASGLPSGAIWCDAGSGNVLKRV